MDIEFHYWITGLVAVRAGFDNDDAYTIAYASQYVDENDVSYEIVDQTDDSRYRNFISQTMNILKPKDSLMRIYPIFHFIPGEPTARSARRRDGKMHLLNATPNSENANRLIDAAFKASLDTRLCRIGIASHSYVDTWAHQNFVGWYDHFNDFGLKPGPAIGHAIAEHHPDWVNQVWTDTRLVDGEASNRSRFLSAAKALFEKYCGYLNVEKKIDNSANWPDLEKELITVMGQTYTGDSRKYEDERLKSYKARLKWNDFDESSWFDEAIETEVNGRIDSKDGLLANMTVFRDDYRWRESVSKEETKWYRFQEAVKEHERLGVKTLSDRFLDMGYDLATV